MLLAALCLASCDDYDDTSLWQKVNEHEERLAALEQWQEETNHNISAIQQLLNTTDCITAVTPLMEGGQEVGYTIQFLHSDPITIYHGTKGDTGHTPQIGLTQGDDGNWYWTLDGQLMQDADGNPIRANGEDGADGADGEDGSTGATGRPGTSAPTPQIKQGSTITSGTIRTDGGTAQADAWYLSVDDGRTWYRVSGKDGNDGDAFFAAAPTLSADGTHYIFKLSDNTEIKVPAYRSLQIGDDAGTGPLYIESTGTTVRLTYPAGTTADDYTALMAQIVPDGSDGTYTSISTRADGTGGWSVTADLAAMTVTVTPGEGTALLRVTLVGNDGSEVTRTRVIEREPFDVDEATKTYTVYTAEGLLAWAQNADSYNCTLAADIDMSGQTSWPRIINYSGTFDGAGHIISNLSISSSGVGTGLIGMLAGGTVKNLLLKDATVNSSSVNTGGIVGAMQSGTVTACAVSGCTVSGLASVGGIAGQLIPFPGNSASVTACYAASCTVTEEGTSRPTPGQIAGKNFGSVTACYYDGTGEGIGSGPGTATQVTNGNWQSAAEEMNKQLAGNDYIWAVNTDEATKASLPLVLVPNTGGQ